MIAKLRVYLALAALVVVSYFVSDWLSPEPASRRPVKSYRPDSFARKFKKTTMTELGKPKYTLIADGMVHFKHNDVTELKIPVFTYFSTDSPPWIVKSQRGVIRSEGESVVLIGNVSISRNEAPGFKPIIINTDKLTIQPKIDFAQTDQFAELISNNNRISGVGLSLYFGEHKNIKIHSNVRGKYESR